MRETKRPGNYHCQTILHTLTFQDVLESNIVIKGIAIVKFAANKCSCNSFCDSKRYIPVNTTVYVLVCCASEDLDATGFFYYFK